MSDKSKSDDEQNPIKEIETSELPTKETRNEDDKNFINGGNNGRSREKE